MITYKCGDINLRGVRLHDYLKMWWYQEFCSCFSLMCIRSFVLVFHWCVFGVLFLFFIDVCLEFCSCFSLMCVWSFVLVFHWCVFGVLFLFKIFRRRFVQNIHLSTLLYKIAFNLWLNKKKQEQNSKHTLRKNKNKTPNTHKWKTRTKLQTHAPKVYITTFVGNHVISLHIYVCLEFCSCFSLMCIRSFVLVFHWCVFGVLFLFFIDVCYMITYKCGDINLRV
jgi:hypothetical protein